MYCMLKVQRTNSCCPNSSHSLKNSDPKWPFWILWRNTLRYWHTASYFMSQHCCVSCVPQRSISSTCWYIFLIPYKSPDSECGPVGFGGVIVTLFGCLWTWLFGPSILWRPFCSKLWHQQRQEHSAGWVSSGPHGLSLRQVLLSHV